MKEWSEGLEPLKGDCIQTVWNAVAKTVSGAKETCTKYIFVLFCFCLLIRIPLDTLIQRLTA